jgi:hypothetical protein
VPLGAEKTAHEMTVLGRIVLETTGDRGIRETIVTDGRIGIGGREAGAGHR